MKLTIHRGAHQIGGNCVEIATDSTRIILDVGLPLPPLDEPPQRRRKRETDLRIKAVFDKLPPVDAVLLSHAHLDHTGLLDHVPSNVPVWMSKGTSQMMQATSIYAGQLELPRERQRTRAPRVPQRIGDITITGYPVDHSVYGAMAFLIEADGKRVLYSGDLRLHGPKPGMARQLIAGVAGKADVLLMEGTHFSGNRERGVTEAELRDDIVRDIRSAPSLVLACFSPTHLDRFVGFFRASIRAGRLFVADHYTAFVLHMIHGDVRTIPHPSDKRIRVFGPQRQPRIAKVACLYEHNEISLEEILREPSRYVMIFRPSMIGKDFNGTLPAGARCIYSYWTGYLAKPDFQTARAKVAEAGGDFLERHTSGHIFAEDIVQFVGAIKPRYVVPIHTNQPKAFKNRFPNLMLLEDGYSWQVPTELSEHPQVGI